MKMESVYKCTENDILAKNVYSKTGILLVSAGLKLTNIDMQKLVDHNIAFVYLEDSNFEDVHIDQTIDMIKQNTLLNVSNDFRKIVFDNSKDIESTVSLIKDMVNYIEENPEININLFEIKAFDDYTYIHSVDTAIMAGYIGKQLGYSKQQLQELCFSALFHDIGKLKISPSIINKKGLLTNDEYYEIVKHPILSRDIVSQIPSVSPSVINGILYHHEKYNGSGYPFGLKDADIPEYSKIISICDVFTAVSARRSYRNRYQPNDCYELILSNSGIMFNSDLVELFKKYFYVYPLGCNVKLSDGTEGYVVRQNPGFPDKPVIRVVYSSTSKRPINPYEIDLIKVTNVVIHNVVSL